MSKSVLFFIFVVAASAQTSTDTLTGDNTTQVKHLHVLLPEIELRGTMPTMFASLVREAGFSGGVAVSNQQCGRGQQSSFAVPARTRFDAALGQLVGDKTMFEWKLRDGVVNLFGTRSVPALLEVRIRRFEWDRAASVREVVDRLRQLPEVSEEALKLGLEEAPIEGGANAICIRGDCSTKPRTETVLETEEGETLLTILNRIVRAHNQVVWGYSDYHCGKGTLFSLEVLAE